MLLCVAIFSQFGLAPSVLQRANNRYPLREALGYIVHSCNKGGSKIREIDVSAVVGVNTASRSWSVHSLIKDSLLRKRPQPVFTNEYGHTVVVSDTPFCFEMRTTTISRQQTSPGRFKTSDHFEVIGRIDWHCWVSSIFRLGGRVGVERLAAQTWVLWTVRFHLLRVRFHDLPPSYCRYYRKKRKASLEITPQAEHMLDLVILTFIYVEKLRWIRGRGEREEPQVEVPNATRCSLAATVALGDIRVVFDETCGGTS
ncbi:hypothetical protein BU15DRAFT_67741 [Melanogaster broomeanus]|nr:hypothetical protein BU15DRAFT_67741 [Melanogaster broomeanus]